jgi:acyl carrier protein
MFSEERLKKVVAAALRLEPALVGEETSTDTVPGWDSIAHMNLVIAIEAEFGISIPDGEVLTLTSYPILRLTVREALDVG